MLFRSGIILFYFSEWAYHIVNELVVKGTPRVGHPAKEGLRHIDANNDQKSCSCAQSGSSSKRGIKTLIIFLLDFFLSDPEWVIQQKRD